MGEACYFGSPIGGGVLFSIEVSVGHGLLLRLSLWWSTLQYRGGLWAWPAASALPLVEYSSVNQYRGGLWAWPAAAALPLVEYSSVWGGWWAWPAASIWLIAGRESEKKTRVPIYGIKGGT